MKVLVVEDSAITASMLVSRLKQILGLQVCGVVVAATEAIEAISVKQPDIVTLDIGLAYGSGFDVLRSIREIQNPPRVIMLSNEYHSTFSKLSISLGAECFFEKGTQFEEFIDRLKQMVLAVKQDAVVQDA